MRYPSVPVPMANLDSLYNTCMALKQIIDVNIGTGTFRKPSIYAQVEQPIDAIKGDFWLAEAPAKTTLSIFTGGKWVVVGTLV